MQQDFLESKRQLDEELEKRSAALSDDHVALENNLRGELAKQEQELIDKSVKLETELLEK